MARLTADNAGRRFCLFRAGHTDTLDADVEGMKFSDCIFPQRGCVNFNSSEIDSDGNGDG